MKLTVKTLHHDDVSTEIVFDGPSLPIMEITLVTGMGRRAYVMLDKEQTEQLVRNLQSQVAEM